MTPTPGIDTENKLTIVPRPSKESKLIIPNNDLTYLVAGPRAERNSLLIGGGLLQYFSESGEKIPIIKLLPFGSTEALHGTWSLHEEGPNYPERIHRDHIELYYKGKEFAEKYTAPYFTLSDFTTEGLMEKRSWFYRTKETGFRLDCKVQLWVPKNS